MKTSAVTRRAKTILILSLLLLAVGGSAAAQSGTKDRSRKRAHRIFAAQTGPDQVTLAWDEVPGTTEYRIYLPDPNKPDPPAPGSRPTMSFSGSGRRAIVTGVSRMANGAYLEALGQGEVLYRGTFNAIARAPLARPTAPAAVQARETGENEVTLSWNPVPGATAYLISRAAGGSGWQMLCDVCPPGGEFVDSTATPGIDHTYTVAAIFPLGISTRTPSNKLTVGAAQLAAATASAPPAGAWDKPMSTGTPVAGTAADNTNVGGSAGTPTTGTTITTGTTTGTTTTGTGTITHTTNSTGGMPGGVSGASVNVTNPITPGGTPVQQLPTTTTQTAVHTATPVTTTQTTTSPIGGVPSGVAGAVGGMLSGAAGAVGGQISPVSTTTHTATPVTTTQTTNNPIGGLLSGAAGAVGSQISPVNTTTHTATPVTTTQTTNNPIGGVLSGATDAVREAVSEVTGAVGGLASGFQTTSPVSPPAGVTASVTGPGTVSLTWQASPTTGVTEYRVNRRVNGGAWDVLNTVGPGTLTYSDAFFPVTMFASGPARVSYNVVALKSTAFSTAATTGELVVQPTAPTAALPTAGTVATACKLEYQRADNMWAAFGHPDGSLGTETILLAPAQDKVFITDWKYEKTRNDGSNYYGSHLRIATNSSSSTIRLQLRSLTLTGLAVFARTGSDTFWIRMDPGKSLQFQADLMEVYCEK